MQACPPTPLRPKPIAIMTFYGSCAEGAHYYMVWQICVRPAVPVCHAFLSRSPGWSMSKGGLSPKLRGST